MRGLEKVGDRFGWIKDGLDQKDRIQKRDLKERAGKENDATLKIREAVQSDEQTRINMYSEGFCYGCSKTDKVISTLLAETMISASEKPRTH